jgi:hypothetical protein
LAGTLAGAKNRESEAGTTPIQKRPQSQYWICTALASYGCSLSQLTFIQTPETNMRSSRNSSLNAFLAKMSRDDARTHREMGMAAAPKGAHAGKEVSNPSKTSAGREPSAR